MLFAHAQVDRCYREVLGRDAIMTGAQEDAHGPGSLHFGTRDDIRCRAADYDDDNVSSAERSEIKRRLDRRLGIDFDVVWEVTHLHVEFDPKRWSE
jgi:hypothetical protein